MYLISPGWTIIIGYLFIGFILTLIFLTLKDKYGIFEDNSDSEIIVACMGWLITILAVGTVIAFASIFFIPAGFVWLIKKMLGRK